MMNRLETHKDEALEILKGSIDTHIHGGPDVVPRKMDDVALARDALKAGMRGLVLKCHVATTEGRAYLARHEVGGIDVWGGIALNHHVGGINPEAVRISVKMGAKIVWMPTVSAENHFHHFGLSGHMDALGGGMKGKGLIILDDKGKLKREVYEVLEVVKEADVILATGHLSPRESVFLAEEALRMGLKKILFTHPEGHLTLLPVDEQIALSRKGVFFERCWVVTTNIAGEKARVPAEELAGSIRSVGPSSTVMATDHGQVVNAAPAQAMLDYIAHMLSFGVKRPEIERMVRSNPAQLLSA
jgi:hypothetical protein